MPVKPLATRRSPLAAWGILLLILAVAAIVLYPTIFWPFDYDQGTFAYGGWAVLHGLRPYIDFWDIKPPNIFYTYAAAFALFGNNVRAVRLFDYINALLSIGLLFALATRLWKDSSWARMAAVLASLIFIVQYYIFGHWDTAQTETYSIPLLLLAMVLAIPKDPVSTRLLSIRSALAGTAIGISFYFKFPNALFLLLIATAIWMKLGTERAMKFKAIGWLIAGFCVAVGFESLYLALNDELVLLWNLTLSETASYVSSNYSGSFTILQNLRTSAHALDLSWVVAGVAGWTYWTVWTARRELNTRSIVRSILLTILGSIIALIIIQAENKGYTYHYGILLPWADLLIGAGVANLVHAVAKLDKFPLGVNAAVMGLILILGSYFWSSSNPLQGRVGELVKIAQGAEPANGYIAGDTIADYVMAHTKLTDKIFIFGFQPYVYWKTGRTPATKFLNTIHFKSTPVPASERDELVHTLSGNPPELFLVEMGDRYTSQGNTNDDSRTTIRLRYPELEQLLDARYTPEDTLQQTIIYRLRHGYPR
ncbi:MAG: ArnT family glycosyltransferase [Candidatus Kapaibacterium sp.]